MKTSQILIIIAAALVCVAAGYGIAMALMALKKYKQLREALSKSGKTISNDGTSKDDSEPSTGQESFWFGLGYSGIAALAAILIPLGLWFGLRVGLLWFGAGEEAKTNAPVMLTLVVLSGVIGLLAVLMMTALAFSAVKLSDKTQALGLPEGSVRAVIALSLIVIFVITVVFLFGNLGRQTNQIEHLTLAQTNVIPGELVAGKHSEEELKRKEAADLRTKA